MKLSLFKTAIMFVLILTTTAYCQHQGLGFSYFGGGARSEGMGQAYIALSNDGAAGGWNPAGLNIHEKTLMGFGYSSLAPRGDYTYYAGPDRTFTFNHSGNIGAINNWSVISPMRIKNHHFVFNFSITRNFDTYYEFREKLYDWSDFDPDDPADDNDPNSFVQRKGGIHSVNLGFGTRIYKQLSFGMSANIYTGRVITNESRLIVYDTSLYDEGTARAVNNVHILDSTSYSGFNLSLGFLYASDRLRSGLLIKTPFVLRGSSDSTLIRSAEVNNIPINLTGSAFGSDTVYIDNMTSRLHMPIMVGFGLAYNFRDNWLMAADVEYRGFKGKVVENLDSLILTATGDRDEYFSATDSIPNWSNVIQFRFGTEYLFNTKYGEVPVRFGFRNETFPEGNIAAYSMTYEGEKEAGGAEIYDADSIEGQRIYYNFKYDTQKITGFSLSLGTGIHWSQILLDVAYTFSSYEQNIYSDAGNLKSKNEWKNHHLNIGFTGYF